MGETVRKLAEEYGIKYALPSFPKLEDHPYQRRIVALMTDEEGSMDAIVGTFTKRVDKEYIYYYLVPSLTYGSITKGLTELYAGLTGAKIYEVRTPTGIEYKVYLRYRYAIALTLLIKPFLIRLSEKADKLLRAFREAPSIKVASREEGLRLRKELGL